MIIIFFKKFFIRSEGFNTQEPARRFAGELQGEVVDFVIFNVSAVYDGLAARIRKCVAFPGPTNCAGGFAWE
jgi:hypothetical protein